MEKNPQSPASCLTEEDSQKLSNAMKQIGNAYTTVRNRWAEDPFVDISPLRSAVNEAIEVILKAGDATIDFESCVITRNEKDLSLTAVGQLEESGRWWIVKKSKEGQPTIITAILKRKLHSIPGIALLGSISKMFNQPEADVLSHLATAKHMLQTMWPEDDPSITSLLTLDMRMKSLEDCVGRHLERAAAAASCKTFKDSASMEELPDTLRRVFDRDP